MAGIGAARTRRRRLAPASGAAALVALAVAAVVLAEEPGNAALSLGSFFDVGPATRAPAVGQPGGVPDDNVATVTYRDGGLVRYAFALHDDGPEAATITEVVGAPPPAETLLRPVAVGLAAPGIVIDPAVGASSGDVLDADVNEPDIEPFHPFTLGRGEDRVIWVWARMADCEYYQPGTSITLVSVKVWYSVRGNAREADLPLPIGVRVNLPSDVRCPRSRPSKKLPPSRGLPQPSIRSPIPPG